MYYDRFLSALFIIAGLTSYIRAEEQIPFKRGTLDRTGYVSLEHFGKLSAPVREAIKKYNTWPTDQRFNELADSIVKQPQAMAEVKAVFDIAVTSGRTEILVSKLKRKVYSGSPNISKWRSELAYSYVLWICQRRKTFIKDGEQLSSRILERVPPQIPQGDAESLFILSEVVAGMEPATTRELLEKVLKIRPFDFAVHTIAGINYTFGMGPTYWVVNGKLVPKEPSKSPCRYDLALAHAKRAIALNADFAPAYYLAYITEPNKAEQLKYLQAYVAHEPDKTSTTYVSATKILSKS